GRAPVTDNLGLDSTKAQLEKGYIRVSPTMETDEPGLFAIGDVVTVEGRPHPMLAHVASHECMGVAERLAGKNTEPVNYARVPSATSSSPEVASVAVSEAESKKRGSAVRVGRFPSGNIAKPRIIGHDGG